MRGGWAAWLRKNVALRKESVDRNNGNRYKIKKADWVALRKESVDRNTGFRAFDCWQSVALRKESVDRNHIGNAASALPSMSLSARRAWIEIQ